jgi:hypothetical protein
LYSFIYFFPFSVSTFSLLLRSFSLFPLPVQVNKINLYRFCRKPGLIFFPGSPQSLPR